MHAAIAAPELSAATKTNLQSTPVGTGHTVTHQQAPQRTLLGLLHQRLVLPLPSVLLLLPPQRPGLLAAAWGPGAAPCRHVAPDAG